LFTNNYIEQIVQFVNPKSSNSAILKMRIADS